MVTPEEDLVVVETDACRADRTFAEALPMSLPLLLAAVVLSSASGNGDKPFAEGQCPRRVRSYDMIVGHARG
jgi:hypothetical protein